MDRSQAARVMLPPSRMGLSFTSGCSQIADEEPPLVFSLACVLLWIRHLPERELSKLTTVDQGPTRRPALQAIDHISGLLRRWCSFTRLVKVVSNFQSRKFQQVSAMLLLSSLG